ncbi:BspA family leucine-rich repeat surface protein [Flagellimonas aequoris]|uniref:BspA family leucine-rich repeat surface protein n=1 Tax=Flagellimonas aequoris TaxID=2306997 RepID=A0A418N3I8_9FLAO|nr:BspA family leucine-rich repeat surface protein [Allomuricauda aequoris]RIV68451.1 BspA family leucine-rich repeat surface protein [Allomuricauda aequoris]TXK00145.1 BspA family leucine-rich repeat surface protein [Allomuricauda aequoris]
MKNIMKKFAVVLLAFAFVWSCSKDDSPTPAKNTVPVIAAQSFSVAADILDTQTIGTVVASDADKDALTFSIKTNDNALFAITTSGVLSLAAGKSLATEPKAQYIITVEVTDGEDAATASITINVAHNAVPIIADQDFSVSEDISDEEIIGTVEATDADNDDLTFEITVNDNDLFEISTSGELSLATGKNLDYETSEKHSITVSVSDGKASSEATVIITVADVDETLAGDPNSFVTTWKTETNNEEIVITTDIVLTYDYIIDWGDGTVETITSSVGASHIYANAGEHKVAIQGMFPHIKMFEQIEMGPKLVSIDQWGNIQWSSMSGAFGDCENMVLKASDTPDLSQVNDMSYMFANATSFNQDISNWDTSNVVDMSYMFSQATSFNQDIGNWDISKVTHTAYMFSEASSFNQNIGNWDTSNVVDMSYMFSQATSFNQDIGNWDISKVTTIAYMFFGASSFNQNLGNWDTSNVTTMHGTFANATSFNQDVGNWDISKVTSIAYMFFGASSFNQNLGNWVIKNITNMDGMFNNSGMSSSKYSATLIGWGNQGNVFIPNGITLGAVGISFCNDSDTDYFRNTVLISENGWTINDTGGAVMCF